MRKALVLAFVSALLFSAVAILPHVSVATAGVGYHDPISPDIPYGPVSPFPNPPDLTVQSPQSNATYYVDAVLLNFTVVNPYKEGENTRIIEISYTFDGQLNTLWNLTDYPLASTRQFSIVLNASTGQHDLKVNVHAECTYYTDPRYIYSTSTFPIVINKKVPFTVDTNAVPPPSVSITSPENRTYITSDVPLNFAVNGLSSQVTYSLDGHDNVTTTENTTLTGLSVGEHSITVYATNIAGNIGASETITFTIAETESFPTAIATVVIVSVAVVASGLAVYFKKRKC